MNRRSRIALFVVLLAFLSLASAIETAANEKVILDTDMVMLLDDGAAMIMLANHPDVDLLGVTVVTGNTWVPEGVAYGIRQLEIMNRTDIPVVAGARFPFRAGRYDTMEIERRMFGIGADEYTGSFGRPEPDSYNTVYSEDFGGVPTIKPVGTHAVDFLIKTIQSNPHEVTVLAIGPCTNLALAIRLAPEIIPLIKRVIYMGGAFDVPGNTTPAAEFNWWYDPEAAKMAVRAPFADQLIVGLDVCEKHHFTKELYDRIVDADTPVTQLFREKYGPRFAANAEYRSLVWDIIAAAVLIDPTLIVKEESRWIDVNDDYTLDYGRSLGYQRQGPPGTRKSRILFTIDERRFWNLVLDLLTQDVRERGQ